MRVWVLRDHYDEISVYSEDTNVLEINYVKDELNSLRGGYEDERNEFIDDYANGRGRLEVEERFVIELVEVR